MKYFAPRYFAPRYFGGKAAAVIPQPVVFSGGGALLPRTYRPGELKPIAAHLSGGGSLSATLIGFGVMNQTATGSGTLTATAIGEINVRRRQKMRDEETIMTWLLAA